MNTDTTTDLIDLQYAAELLATHAARIAELADAIGLDQLAATDPAAARLSARVEVAASIARRVDYTIATRTGGRS